MACLPTLAIGIQKPLPRSDLPLVAFVVMEFFLLDLGDNLQELKRDLFAGLVSKK
jgi:hypothetical protein